jgi:hypothetical protein
VAGEVHLMETFHSFSPMDVDDSDEIHASHDLNDPFYGSCGLDADNSSNGDGEEEGIQIPSKSASFSNKRLFGEPSNIESKRIPHSYRRRKVIDSKRDDVDGKKDERDIVLEIGQSACSSDSILSNMGQGTMDLWRVDGSDGSSARRISFSERRRKRLSNSSITQLQPLDGNSTSFDPSQNVMDLDSHSKSGANSKKSLEEDEDKQKTSQHFEMVGNGMGAASLESRPQRPLKLFERNAEEPMRVMRMKRRRESEVEKEISSKTKPTTPEASSSSSSIPSLEVNHNKIGSHIKLETVRSLEQRLKDLLAKKRFSEDVLEMVREDLSSLDGQMTKTRNEGYDKVTSLKRRVNEAMQSMRLKMVSYMTETTQNTFEALEDVRSMLIAQILADEEAVQLELEKMDVEMGNIAQPLQLLQQVTHFATSSSVPIQTPTGMMAVGVSGMGMPLSVSPGPMAVHPPPPPPPPQMSLTGATNMGSVNDVSLVPNMGLMGSGIHSIPSTQPASMPLSSNNANAPTNAFSLGHASSPF